MLLQVADSLTASESDTPHQVQVVTLDSQQITDLTAEVALGADIYLADRDILTEGELRRSCYRSAVGGLQRDFTFGAALCRNDDGDTTVLATLDNGDVGNGRCLTGQNDFCDTVKVTTIEEERTATQYRAGTECSECDTTCILIGVQVIVGAGCQR